MTAKRLSRCRDCLQRVVAVFLTLLLLMTVSLYACAEETSFYKKEQINVQIRTVKTETFSMDYCCFGSGQEAFVIIPGLSVQSVMGSAEAIGRAYRSLTEDYTVYVFDRRKDVPPEYTVHEMARDTAEAMKYLGLERVCLFGASQGGMMSMEIAADYPELVEKLVVSSTTAQVTSERYEIISNWVDLAEKGDAQALYLSFGKALYPESIFEQSKELLCEIARTVTHEELQRFIIMAKAVEGFDCRADLSRIECPVLAIGSKDDQLFGADATLQIAEYFKDRPDFASYLYENYGHACYDTAPDFLERVSRFLAK